MNHELIVTGMTCGHCEKAVTKALQNLDPAAKITIDRNRNLVTIESDQPIIELAKAITDAGYNVTP
ncbi:MAG: hypothetical protein RLZZ591_1698 [Pseudomonadota bacterium]|jgi:copper chaperone